MMLQRYEETPMILLYLIPVMLISLAFHEFSHAYISNGLGDPTPKKMGRMTLNPLKHLDVLGALTLLLTGYGWGKSVPIHPMYYQDQKKGVLLVSFAGPLSNIVLAFIFAFPMLYLKAVYHFKEDTLLMGWDAIAIFYNFSYLMFWINSRLAALNILPIPPLDGSKLLSSLFSSKQYASILQYSNVIKIAFLILLFILPQVFEFLLEPVVWVIDTAICSVVNNIISMLLY